MTQQAHPAAGDTVRATVTAVETYGVHLTCGGIDVLVHVADLEWAQALDVREHVHVGDELDVKILRTVSETDAAGWLPAPAGHESSSGRARSEHPAQR